jgi:plasmid maintenance system antidote protein VapI
VQIPDGLPKRLEDAMHAYGHTVQAAAEAMDVKDRATVTKLLKGTDRVLQETINAAEIYIQAAPPSSPMVG